ncbi:MAG: hypothetical protein RIR43_1841 [Pseudomonadota bacterium]|jgi:P-type Cu+ transporter
MSHSDLTLDIEGMTCASCVRRVERALQRVPGVQACSVNLATNQATVSPEASRPPVSALIEAVERAGYHAQLHEDSAAPAAAHDPGWAVGLAVLLSLPLVAPMLLQPLGIHFMPSPLWQWLLATPVQLVLGWRFYRAAWSALKDHSGNMDLLVALGTSAAYGLSVWLWLGADSADPHLYFEGSAVVITLVMLGKWLEARAKRRTLSALDALRALRPETAWVMVDGAPQERALGLVRVGDLVMVRPGQRIPIDGQIAEGRSHVDESAVTGESLPVPREAGQPVVGGTLNAEGLLLVRTTAVGSETALSRIVRLVEQAQARKAPIQQTVDRVSAVFVPAVVGVAVLTLLAWGWGAPQHGWETAIVQAVSVLVIACPCALGLATPATLMVGTGMAARMGLLVRDAPSLERLRDVKVLAMDKTGTLTQGRPTLQALVVAGQEHGPLHGPGNTDQRAALLALAAGLQQGSEHPLAHAVRQAADAQSLSPQPFHAVEVVAGRGIRGVTQASPPPRSMLLGSVAWMSELGIDLQPLASAIEQAHAQGHTVSILAEKDRALALLSFGDSLRPEARAAVQALQAQGVRCVMISGDNPAAARHIAAQVGISEVQAPVLPQEKAQAIQALRRTLSPTERIAMVGDGINDAPALAAADIGLAMPGTDVAMETAGLTLLRADLQLIPQAIGLSKAVARKVHQNLFWAFAYNVVGIPLAALGYLSPVVAGAAMAASSVSVISNALLLRRWQP